MSKKEERFQQNLRSKQWLYAKVERVVKILSYHDWTASALDRWISQFQQSGSFRENDNCSPEEQELVELRKRNKRLEKEIDILKHVALIMGRK